MLGVNRSYQNVLLIIYFESKNQKNFYKHFDFSGSTYNYFQNISHYKGIFYHPLNNSTKIKHEMNCYSKLLKIHPSSDGVDLSYVKQNNLNI